eukprot:257413_1
MSAQGSGNPEETSSIVRYESLIPSRKTTVQLSHLSSHSPLLSNSGQIVLLDLDNRIERLSRWILCYFVFSITEMITHAIHTRDTLSSGIESSSYQLWLSSDIFLVIGCVLTWVSLHYIPDIPNLKPKYDRYLKYIAGGLFILCGILQWIAISQHNYSVFCVVMSSRCKSFAFGMHWMGHFFAIFIGIDIVDRDTLSFLFNARKVGRSHSLMAD